MRSHAHVSSNIDESLIQDAFHSLLQGALIQAHAEGLLSSQEISSHDAEIKIIAASLALYFAALQAHGDPPSLFFTSNNDTFLNETNCPVSFLSYFKLWQQSVIRIQRCNFDQRHDLALLLCEKEPSNSLIQIQVVSLARDLKAVALDIAQRSTFQSRFQSDVQSAIDSSLKTNSNGNSYIAPPRDTSNGSTSPLSSSKSPSPIYKEKPLPSAPLPRNAGEKNGRRHGIAYRALPPPPVPVIAIEPPKEESTTLMLIRETLFAALGDVLASNKDLLALLENNINKSWSSRCYFASLCLAILDVCLYRVNLPSLPDMKHMTAGIRRRSFPWNEAYVRTVHVPNTQDRITMENCPLEMSKMLIGVFRIGMFVQSLSASDTIRAVQDASEDKITDEGDLYINRLQRRLLGDVTIPASHLERGGEEHVKDAALMINRLALSMFEIPSFRQRQTEAFAILNAITSM